MKNTDRLKVVLDLENRKKDNAAKALAEAIQNLEKAKSSKQQLTDYRAEYQKQAQEIGKGGVSAASFRNRQLIADQLKGAMDKQAQSIDLYERQLHQVRAHYEKVYARVRSIEILIEKAEKQEEYKMSVKEQKMMDDFTQAQLARQRSSI
jgi:flagellar export protein FliJ